MATDINKVMLVGRLTRDCEIKPLTNTSVCNFAIAVNRRANQGGNWVEEPNFFDVELYGALGPALQSYLTKGKQVAVEGSLRQHRWETPDQQKRSRITIVADNVQLLGGNTGGTGQSAGVSPQGGYQAQTNVGDVPNSSMNNSSLADFQDDIPF